MLVVLWNSRCCGRAFRPETLLLDELGYSLAKLHELIQCRRWNISNLLIPVTRSLDEFEHILDSLLRNRVRVILGGNFFSNGSKHRQSRIEFTLLALLDDDPK